MGLFDPLDITWIWNSSQMKSKLLDGMSDASTGLGMLEYMVSSGEDLATVRKYKDALDKTAVWLQTPEAVVENYKAAMKISRGISHLRKIGPIHNDPAGAAWAFGKIFKGIGDLSTHLPPGLAGYLGIFRNAETFFTDIRYLRSIEVHFREPRARETLIDNDSSYPGY